MIIDSITVSTSRFMQYGAVSGPDDAEDVSGKAIVEKITASGHDFRYRLIPDGVMPVRIALLESIERKSDAVIFCGGTGLSPSDLTIEAIEPLVEKSIPGFGEIFRLKSMEQVGTRVMLTRASAGIISGVPVFAIPGSPAAASLGIELILQELEHILQHVRGR
ncbi:MogA/MoaB family molybdenum cofactor biosynthesis protein [Methanothrix thermoacetophila]|jgi:molybdenum cofactor biosynthesis protein B|uniref:Molybdenum cofactor synthesis domain n=1 Tax=Methanothrix thermoacetophila (strain DSM 6194 / JCM 14653 / NBRC 101360 / PT) TaxID=349307 RepID=A0B5X7_METTP|nr:MogA/MoaB family molybdenum cofactor biosynthesis protein [Methanothrix thermoacetophila]ABK14101.1 molybdenum cofactor synthesis domain [Methanothrix thermoacetophila PT]